MSEPIVKKAYYSIGDVCDLTGLKPHVLRYWETQFDILRPTKNRAGNRVYRPKDIELVLLVKNLLYEQKYTIEGANQKLVDMRREGELEDGQQEVLGPEFLASMKVELEALVKVLTPSEPLPDLVPSEEAGSGAGEVGAGAATEAGEIEAAAETGAAPVAGEIEAAAETGAAPVAEAGAVTEEPRGNTAQADVFEAAEEDGGGDEGGSPERDGAPE